MDLCKNKKNGRENCFTQLMPNIKIYSLFFYVVNAEVCLNAADMLFNLYENFGVIAEQESKKKGGAPL